MVAAATADWSDKLADFLKALATGINSGSGMSAIVAIVVLVGILILLVYRDKIGGLVVLLIVALVAIVGVVAVSAIGVQKQTKENEKLPQVTVSAKANTLKIVDRLDADQKKDIIDALRGAAEETADVLGIAKDLVRSNLFGLDENSRAKIVRGLTFNMNRPEELTVSMPIGYGSTGRCFQSGKPNIAVLKEDWGANRIEDPEIQKLDPELRWVISVPVIGKGDQGGPIWVLNVDGLKERREEADLQKALRHLYSWSYAISIVISKAVEQVAVAPKQSVPPQSDPIASHHTVTAVKAADVAPPGDRFLQTARDSTNLDTINTLTKHDFASQVQTTFASPK